VEGNSGGLCYCTLSILSQDLYGGSEGNYEKPVRITGPCQDICDIENIKQEWQPIDMTFSVVEVKL
jgi:hypothetical protein